MIDLDKSSKKDLIKEYDRCQKDWGKCSSDSFGYYIIAIHKRILELGGW